MRSQNPESLQHELDDCNCKVMSITSILLLVSTHRMHRLAKQLYQSVALPAHLFILPTRAIRMMSREIAPDDGEDGAVQNIDPDARRQSTCEQIHDALI